MFWVSMNLFFFFCLFVDSILTSQVQTVAILTLITHCIFVGPVFSDCETRTVYVRLCGRAPRVSACARALCGACRYCSSTEWFVSYNGGAGRTVLRQERQDRRTLRFKRVKRTEERWSRQKQQQQQQYYVCQRVSWTWPCDCWLPGCSST